MPTGGCLEVSLAEWGKQLLAPLNGGRYPLGGMVELTERCNLSCVHCYINQPARSQRARQSELSTRDVLALLDDMATAGTLFVAFSGGEVLLRRDFAEIYRGACARGMLVTVMTNATLVTPQIANLLADRPPRMVEVTLYGATTQTYDRVTRTPGSFARCQRGVAMLHERGVPLELKAVLLTINRHELPNLQAWAAKLGTSLRYDGLLWPRLDGGTQPYAYQLPAQELLALDCDDLARSSEWSRLIAWGADREVRTEYVYNCGAGLQTYHIDCAGRMCICTMSRRPSFDLKSMGFAEAWERLGELRCLKRRLDTPCVTCRAGIMCAQCPGWSQAVHGDDETPVDFVCALARLRAERLAGIDVPHPQSRGGGAE